MANRRWFKLNMALHASVAFLMVLCSCAKRTPTRYQLLACAGLDMNGNVFDALQNRDVQPLLRVEDRDALGDVADWAHEFTECNFEVGYWIEVARSASLADSQPNLMASLQGHDQWRALFPNAEKAKAGEVIKVYPWVPITTREGFDAQLARIAKILDLLPPARDIYLNDLQSAPSSCGCGHPTCRWATDYFLPSAEHATEIASGTPLGPEAAADFVDAVKKLAKGARVVPVWVAECTRGDARCRGVPCFDGACWPELTGAWAPIAARNQKLAVFVPSAAIGLPPSTDDEVERAVSALARVVHDGEALVQIDRARITPIVEGRVYDNDDFNRYSEPAWLVTSAAIEQSWEPRVVARPR